MANYRSRCPHVATIGTIEENDYQNAIQKDRCDQCEIGGPHLWLCLREGCLFVGCGSGKDKNDHSGDHEKEKAHPLQFNLKTKRIWCYSCQQEVLPQNDPPFQVPSIDRRIIPTKSSSIVVNEEETIENSLEINFIHLSSAETNLTHSSLHSHHHSHSHHQHHHHQKSPSKTETNEKAFEPILFELEHSDLKTLTPGVLGLYNLGNTCYMNSALQALSNCVPLTSYFLDLSSLILSSSHPRTISSDRKSNGKLGKAYCKFLQSMWLKQKSGSTNEIINPNSIANEIRSTNPSFRSYSQQDVQEFLRCFMDELHSETKFIQMSSDEKQRSSSSSSTTTTTTDIQIPLNNLTLDSEYESCSSEFDENSDRDEKSSRQCLSRTDSGISFQTTSNQQRIIRESEQRKKRQTYFSSSSTTNPLVTTKSQTTTSIISAIFDGFIQSEIECLTCYRRSKTIETFQDLSLPLPSREQVEKFHSISLGNDEQMNSDSNSSDSWSSWFYSLFKNLLTMNIWSPTLTLQDCLQAFFQADQLTGDNMYSCDKCGKLRNGVKYCRVLQLPEVLCIHLKRFRHDSMISSKIGNYVSFPLVDLDMTPFIHKDCRSKVTNYDLFSCIVHYGRAGSGHYVTYSLNSLTQQWFEFDDDIVRPIDPNVVQNAEAYVLFYRKKEFNISETYETVRHLLSTDEDNLLPYYISRYWINRLFYFAEPGPISNEDFLCKHGGVYPSYWSLINDLVTPVPESVWRFLSEKYGGSSSCNILYPCRKCQLEEENLKCRQRSEKNTFLQLKRLEKESDAIYALSPTWFREWQNFVCEKTFEIPSAISNQGISTTKNGQTRLIRRDCNHLQISEQIWNYLYSIYGGGPEILIRSKSSNDYQHDDQISSNFKSSFSSSSSS